MLPLFRICHSWGLSFSYKLHNWYLLRLEQQELEGLSAVQRQDPNFVPSIRYKTEVAREQWLRSALQKTPYWRFGHKELAELFLYKRDIPAAYACSVAVAKLSSQNSEWSNYASFLSAKCFLAQGNVERARQVLKELVQKPIRGITEAALTEELAAAEIALGNLSQAVQLLESIPEKSRSAQAHSALLFVRQKVSNPNEVLPFTVR